MEIGSKTDNSFSFNRSENLKNEVIGRWFLSTLYCDGSGKRRM